MNLLFSLLPFIAFCLVILVMKCTAVFCLFGAEDVEYVIWLELISCVTCVLVSNLANPNQSCLSDSSSNSSSSSDL